MKRQPKKQKPKAAAQVRKPRVVAAADACDEAAGRLDVVLGMIRDCLDSKDDTGYGFLMIEEAIESIGDLCRKGSAEYTAAMEAEEKGGA
jgi:hypothetical protein